MQKEGQNKRSLVDQIFDEMLAKIEKSKEFDNATIEKLRNLVKQGDFSDVSKIVEAIGPHMSLNNENH